MQKIDVPVDHVLIKELDAWRESLDLENCLMKDSIHDYDGSIDKKEIMKQLSKEYLEEVVIPNEGNYDFGKTNLVDLDFQSTSHSNIYETFSKSMLLDGFKLENPSGAFWYPKNGYMGWHSNADHDAYRLYAAWSEKGHQSFFRFRDPKTGNITTSWDKKGWTFRLFNCTSDEKVWHCVYSGGSRISLGFWYERIPTSV